MEWNLTDNNPQQGYLIRFATTKNEVFLKMSSVNTTKALK